MKSEASSNWAEAPPSLSLESGAVHVWRVSLDQPDERLDRFRRTLEPDELNRASRFHFDKHRRHFIVARGFLRSIVGRYLEMQPKALRFSYGPYGKPALASEHVLRFNLSHSHEVALLAVALDAELGVDVEHIRADFASEEIAQRFFSRAEVEVFNSLPKDEQVAAFFRCWTRKEAYIKAIGKGLSQALDGFDVTLAPDAAPALLRAEGDDASRWLLTDLSAGAGYAAALAIEAPITTICCFQNDI